MTLLRDSVLHEALSFDDILLVPQFSKVESRKNIPLSTSLSNGVDLELPVIASPMDTVSEAEMALSMAKAGGLAVIHRYNTIVEQCSVIKKAQKLWYDDYLERYQRAMVEEIPSLNVAAAIGVGGDYFERAMALVEQGVRILCVDVAHGHHVLVKKAIQKLRRQFGSDVHIMAGNVATGEGYRCLARWGADSVRLGVGSGSICSTRIQTGHGVPLASTIVDAFLVKKTEEFKTALIADGGIKNGGDAVKALALGADAVMCGSLLAGTTETPGDVVMGPDGRKYKTYRGMASRQAQKDWRGQSSAPEGISTTVEYKGPVNDILADLKGNIQSGLSYSGAADLKELQECAMFIKQTNAGQHESSTHILARR